MKKLRVVQPRTQSVQTHFDLRGLDSVKSKSFPVTGLAIESKKPPKHLKDYCDLVGVDLHSSKNKHFILHRDRKEGEHKIQAVQLFTLYLKAFEEMGEGTKAVLAVINPMSFLLKSKNISELKIEDPINEMLMKKLKGASPGGLSCSPDAALAINRAGFEHIHSDHQNITFVAFSKLVEVRDDLVSRLSSIQHNIEQRKREAG
jgi:hypothetical protein